jgi:PKD repeat protein
VRTGFRNRYQIDQIGEPAGPAIETMNRRLLTRLCVACLLLTAGACTMKKQEAPALSGPSEFGTSISISASPDILTQDGVSRSYITITARDASNQPIRGLTLRVEIQVDGVPADFGLISARSVVTGTEGRATLMYTAPAAPRVAVDDGTVVDIAATPVGTDYNNSHARIASIRLIPPGVIIPPVPGDGMRPAFTLSPSAPQDHQNVLFDASASQPASAIAEYRWSFGDGGTGSGRTVTHAFQNVGSYVVTLTIVDAYGRSASTSQSVSVTGGTSPSASFVFSPTAPAPGQQVNFNASASKPAPGQTIASYSWDFGDGTAPGSGVQASHTYRTAGTYNVTLVVTDNAGRTAAASVQVPVK